MYSLNLQSNLLLQSSYQCNGEKKAHDFPLRCRGEEVENSKYKHLNSTCVNVWYLVTLQQLCSVSDYTHRTLAFVLCINISLSDWVIAFSLSYISRCPLLKWSDLQLLSSVALAGISSTQSAGNQPTWPRALPSQKPPSPMLRTGSTGEGEGEKSVRGWSGKKNDTSFTAQMPQSQCIPWDHLKHLRKMPHLNIKCNRKNKTNVSASRKVT